EIGSQLRRHLAEHSPQRPRGISRAHDPRLRRGWRAAHADRHGGARGGGGRQPPSGPDGGGRPRRRDLQTARGPPARAPTRITTPEFRANAEVEPKHQGPLVAAARLLGPDAKLGYLFVLPTVVLVLALVAYPFCYAIYLSMTRKYVGVPPVFVGLDNYIKLTHDGFFQRAVINSFIFTFGSVGVKLVLGMVMAIVLTSAIRWRSFWTGVLVPLWSPPAAVSPPTFLRLFNHRLGALNSPLSKLSPRFPRGGGWLSGPKPALFSVSGVTFGRGSPFSAISFLAAPRAIPAE